MPSIEQVFGDHLRLFDDLAELSTRMSAGNVVEETPKFSGQARASVNYALNKPDTSVTLVANYRRNAISNTISSAKAEFKLKSKALVLGQRVYITSSIDYATAIEFAYGYRPFTKSIQSWQITVNEAISILRAK